MKNQETSYATSVVERPQQEVATDKSNYELLLFEYQSVRKELDQIHADLRTLTRPFIALSRMLDATGVSALKPLCSLASKNIWVKRVFAFPATLCAWAYFRVRLPHVFQYVTAENYIQPRNDSRKSEAVFDSEIEEIAQSGLFDLHYYLAQAPEARYFPYGPIGHYLAKGHNLSPHRLFDVNYFLSSNQNLNCPKGVAPLLHYVRSTGKEGYNPHPLFDAVFYMEKSGEGCEAFAKTNPLRHYLTLASRSLDPHPYFNTLDYLHKYEEARQATCTPLEHFLLWGYTGRFAPNDLFDSEYYLQHNLHLRLTQTNPLLHYMLQKTNLNANVHPLFNAQYYLDQLTNEEKTLAAPDPLAHCLHSESGKFTSPHPLFDPELYLKQAPYLKDIKRHALLHYIKYGEAANLAPNSLFQVNWFAMQHPEAVEKGLNLLTYYARDPKSIEGSTHPFFEIGHYLEQYPESAKTPGGPLAHYLLLNQALRASVSTVQKPFSTNRATEDNESELLADAFQELLNLSAKPFTHLFLIPGLVRGGAERAACNYIQYLQEKLGKENLLILFTEYPDNTCLDWLPEGSRYIDIVQLADLNFEDRGMLVTAFIMEKQPKITYCSNAYSYLYSAVRYRDMLEQKSLFVNFLFGYEAYIPGGPAPLNEVPHCGPTNWAHCVITDNQKLKELAINTLNERQLPDKTTECCYNSSLNLEPLLATYGIPEARAGKQVLWASRLVETKRPDILIEVAKRLPDVEFLVYGSAETGVQADTDVFLKMLNEIPNIQYFGAYPSFDSIDKTKVGVFLYTTSSDGIPIVLLEAAACGLPLVAPAIGGITEFVTDETGWLIEKFDDVEAHANAVRFALENKNIAHKKAVAAHALVKARHSQESVKKRLDEIQVYFD